MDLTSIVQMQLDQLYAKVVAAETRAATAEADIASITGIKNGAAAEALDLRAQIAQIVQTAADQGFTVTDPTIPVPPPDPAPDPTP